MGAPLTDESKRLLRMLEDGQWHPLAAIKHKLGETVPPGKALREYDKKAAQYHEKIAPRVGPELSDEKKIASGQRQIAYITIRSMKRNFVEIRDVPGGPPQIRLRPEILAEYRRDEQQETTTGEQTVQQPQEEPDSPKSVESGPSEHGDSPPPLTVADGPRACDSCGLYVANHVQHEEFHNTLDTPVACAFFSESQVRSLIRAEVEQSLDAFQRGMQNWLIHRFAALETMLQGLPRSRDDRLRRMGRGFDR